MRSIPRRPGSETDEAAQHARLHDLAIVWLLNVPTPSQWAELLALAESHHCASCTANGPRSVEDVRRDLIRAAEQALQTREGFEDAASAAGWKCSVSEHMETPKGWRHGPFCKYDSHAAAASTSKTRTRST